MACKDCYTNCAGNTPSDQCVVYTGPDITFLGISTGDSLSLLEAALIAQIETLLDGTGITFENLTTCSAITQELEGQEVTLATLVQAISNVVCDLRSDLDTLEGQVNAPISFDTSCLTGIPTNPTRDDILQATLNKLCAVSTSVDGILADYVKDSELCTKVNDCLEQVIVQEYTKFPKYIAVPYHGPLSVFDSQGRGLASAGYDKIYICNGQTVGTYTTPDYRGRSPIGVNTNIPGGSLDSSVDPSLAANAGYSFVQNTKKGNYTHTLSVSESASHTHTVTDPGHTHNFTHGKDNASGNNFSGYMKWDSSGSIKPTESAVTGITIGSSGGGQPHNTVHPVIGGVFIMHIP